MVVTESKPVPRRGLVVGNYCHDVLHRDAAVVAETLGGAASFISVILDALSLPFHTVSKVGPDFAYSAATSNHPPLTIPDSQTTLFHAHFASPNSDRLLNRVRSCHPIRPEDLPDQPRFRFGLAVGVAGEILPETLEKMLDICDHVFVDIQALVRRFDSLHGRVTHVPLRDTGFFHLLPRIAFLKSSADEAAFLDLDQARNCCCVLVTHGKDGCEIFFQNASFKAAPFHAHQLDPTGAGDCFLGGFAAGIVTGLSLPHAALLGNFFGSLAVEQLGPPKLHSTLIQMVKDEMHKRKAVDIPCLERRYELPGFQKPPEQDQFYASLVTAKALIMCKIQESGLNLLSSPKVLEQNDAKTRQSLNSVHEEPITSVDVVLSTTQTEMADSICRTLRDGALEGELAPTLTIKDSLASPFAFHVFSHILLQLSSHVAAQKSQSQGIVIVALSHSPSSYTALLKGNGVDVASSSKWIHILDCYTDPLGWKDKTRKSVNFTDLSHPISLVTSSYKTVKDVDKLFSAITELGRGLVGENKACFCVAIDSLSELLRHASLQSVASLLSNLRSHDQVSSIFGILHSDLHEERYVTVLEYMLSMVASVDPYHQFADGQQGCLENSLSEQNLTKGKFNVRSKRRNGRVRVTCEEFKVEPGGISFTSVSSVDGTTISGLLPKVQFNLQLSEKEIFDRSNVVLPFEHQGNGKPIQIYDGRRSLEENSSEANPTSSDKKEDSGIGEIIYFRDSDDEMPDSDEDPDDDLDI